MPGARKRAREETFVSSKFPPFCVGCSIFQSYRRKKRGKSSRFCKFYHKMPRRGKKLWRGVVLFPHSVTIGKKKKHIGGNEHEMVCDRQDADAAGPRAGERRGGGAAEFGRAGARNGAAGARRGASSHAERAGRARLQGGGALQLPERNACAAARPQGRHTPLLRLSRDEGLRGTGGRRRDG